MKIFFYALSLLFLISCANETNSIDRHRSDMEPMEAGIIMASIGPLWKVQIDPDSRWFVFSGRNDVKIFPVKIGTTVKADSYVFFGDSMGTQWYGKDKQSPTLKIDRPGLYFYSTVVCRQGGYSISNEPDYQILRSAEEKYPTEFSKMNHVNFNMEELKTKFLTEQSERERKDAAAREKLDKGLPTPQPIQ